MLLRKVTQSLHVVGCNSRTCFGFYGHGHVPDYEVHFNAAREPPVMKLRESRMIRVVGRQLVKHPILEGFAVEFTASFQMAAASQEIYDADIRKIELWRANYATFRSFRVRR